MTVCRIVACDEIALTTRLTAWDGTHGPAQRDRHSVAANNAAVSISFLLSNTRTASVVWWSEFLATNPEVRVLFPALHYQIFWEVVSLERGPLSLVSTTEELLERKSSRFGLKIREYGRRDPSHWPRDTLYPQKLALTSPTSGSLLGRYSSLADSRQGVFLSNIRVESLRRTGVIALKENQRKTQWLVQRIFKCKW
jgi:hypothetical protein